jgi:uncharacterized BrkB/YihY/UPF0761 family membrane protein
MPHVRLFAIQFALCLLTLILFGIGFSGTPKLFLPVLLHLIALICAGYVARPIRSIQSQYTLLILTIFYGAIWIMYTVAYNNPLPNTDAVSAGYVFYAMSIVTTVYITKQFKREIEPDPLESIQPAVPGF